MAGEEIFPTPVEITWSFDRQNQGSNSYGVSEDNMTATFTNNQTWKSLFFEQAIPMTGVHEWTVKLHGNIGNWVLGVSNDQNNRTRENAFSDTPDGIGFWFRNGRGDW